MQKFFNIDNAVIELSKKVMNEYKDSFDYVDSITEYNQNKVLSAFIKNGVSESHFAPSTGYGYNDRGREVIEQTFADIMGAEDSLFRHNFMSGTHAISVAMFGILRPGDTLLCVTGTPYDTLHGVIGLTEESGSLKDFHVKYDEVSLADGKVDFDAIEARLKKEPVKVVYVQRSRGYTLRDSLCIETIGKIVKLVKGIQQDIIVMVDNCYGEFAEKYEPTDVGADIIIGSLIKNPGGGIAPTGGYIAGKKELIELCANRLTAPGVGKEIGATLNMSRSLFMGLFNAPHVTGEAIKNAIFTAGIFESLGYEVTPKPAEIRSDIIGAIILKSESALTSFCKGMQSGAPIDAFVVPEAWDMPGYEDKVIMAAGAFTAGASIELSADAPIRPPYAAWLQGALNFHSGKTGILLAVQQMIKEGVISI